MLEFLLYFDKNVITGIGATEKFGNLTPLYSETQMVADSTTETLYIGFGQTIDGYQLQDFYKFHVPTNTLTKLNDIPDYGASAGSRMVIVGRDIICSVNSIVLSFNMDTELWTTRPWTGGTGASRYGGTYGFALEYNGKALFVRQRPGSTGQIQIMVYDPVTNAWSAMETIGNTAPTPGPRIWGGIMNNKIFIFGLSNPATGSDKYIVYDTVGKTTATKTGLRTYTATGEQAISYNNHIYVSTGYTVDDPTLFYEMSESGGVLSERMLPRLTRSIYFAGTALLGNKMYVDAGRMILAPSTRYRDMFSYQLTE